jgi:hypothetical protein
MCNKKNVPCLCNQVINHAFAIVVCPPWWTFTTSVLYTWPLEAVNTTTRDARGSCGKIASSEKIGSSFTSIGIHKNWDKDLEVDGQSSWSASFVVEAREKTAHPTCDMVQEPSLTKPWKSQIIETLVFLYCTATISGEISLILSLIP